LFVIEDCAQAFGAEYNGKKACALGDISITSFFPAKPLGGYGDSGMIFTDNKEIANKIRKIRNHGQEKKYEHEIIGLNLRLDTIQAAVLLAKLEEFIKNEIEERIKLAELYNTNLRNLEEENKIILPHVRKFNKSVYAQYTIQAEKRDELKIFLEKKEIPTAIHYPIPLHLQKAFSYLKYKEGKFPVSEKTSTRIISLPLDAYKTEDEIGFVCESIKEFYKSNISIEE